MPVEESCSRDRCQNPRATNKPWCKEHLAEYARNYRGTVLDQAERRGFHKGVAAMREYVVSEFERFPNAVFTGAEMGLKVRAAPSPMADEEPTPE